MLVVKHDELRRDVLDGFVKACFTFGEERGDAMKGRESRSADWLDAVLERNSVLLGNLPSSLINGAQTSRPASSAETVSDQTLQPKR